MVEIIGALMGIGGGFVIGAAVLGMLVLSFCLPFMAWSATRNIRDIRRQLERLNDTLESRSPARGTGTFGL